MLSKVKRKINQAKAEKYRKLIRDEVDQYLVNKGYAWSEFSDGYCFTKGSCYVRWDYEKKLLKERYGIDWFTPAEENPNVRFVRYIL